MSHDQNDDTDADYFLKAGELPREAQVPLVTEEDTPSPRWVELVIVLALSLYSLLVLACLYFHIPGRIADYLAK